MTYQPPQQQTPYYPPAPPISPAPPEPAVAAPPRRIGAIVGALVAGVVLGIGGTVAAYQAFGDDQASTSAAPAAGSAGPNFKTVLDACGGGDGTLPGRTVADGGKTLILETGASGISFDRVACVLGKLGASDAVVQHMDTTRALDGQQTDTWAGLSARWTYHPENGLKLTITKS